MRVRSAVQGTAAGSKMAKERSGQKANNWQHINALQGTHGGKECIQVWEREIRSNTKLQQIMVPTNTDVEIECTGL